MDPRDKRTFMQHWPVLILGLVVAVLFLAALFVFQVKETQYAIVVRFGSPVMAVPDQARVYPPGLHPRLPVIDTVWKHDNRLQCYELKIGQVEQVQTADNYQIIVTTYVLWRVSKDNAGKFFVAVNTTEAAQSNLDDIIRNARKTILGRRKLTELINTDVSQVKIPEIEKEILDAVAPVAMQNYGIEIVNVGFKHLGFPEQVSEKVFARMRAERKRMSEKYLAEGDREAQTIKAEANALADDIVNRAEAEAMRIRGEGDREAAEAYAAFSENPELAIFLRKLESLRKTLANKTTLVIDTNTPPYDLLAPGAIDLQKARIKDETQADKN